MLRALLGLSDAPAEGVSSSSMVLGSSGMVCVWSAPTEVSNERTVARVDSGSDRMVRRVRLTALTAAGSNLGPDL